MRSQFIHGEVVIEHKFIEALPIVLGVLSLIVVDIPLYQLPDSMDSNRIIDNWHDLEIHFYQMLSVNIQRVNQPLRVPVNDHILDIQIAFLWLINCVIVRNVITDVIMVDDLRENSTREDQLISSPKLQKNLGFISYLLPQQLKKDLILHQK